MAAAAALCAVLLSAPTPAAAETAKRDTDDVVVAGFRNDVEPFSFRNRTPLERRFDGYIADFCYDVFQGSAYKVVPVLVTAEDRFTRIKANGTVDYDPKGPETEQDIDILCDPVTLLSSKPEDRARTASSLRSCSSLAYPTCCGRHATLRVTPTCSMSATQPHPRSCNWPAK